MRRNLVRLLPCAICLALVAHPMPAAEAPSPVKSELLFAESFDDARLLQRGWYDGNRFKISADAPAAGAGCIEYHWRQGATSPETGGAVRRLFSPSDAIHLRFRMRLSKGWRWTGREYHPHLIQVMTTENQQYHGPAASHLTLYVEPQEGRLRLAAQDIMNKDRPHGLTQGPLKGGYNGKLYDSKSPVFTDDRWHTVDALFKLNRLDLKQDRPVADGVVRGWVDGKLVVDRTDVVLRSTDFPNMKLNQLLVAPYFGPGLLPQEQTLWLDELSLGAVGRPE